MWPKLMCAENFLHKYDSVPECPTFTESKLTCAGNFLHKYDSVPECPTFSESYVTI